MQIVNRIENEGAKSLGELLTLMNKTLTRLDLSCKGKRTRISQEYLANRFLYNLTVNRIEETGATSLSAALKSNTALIELDLHCGCKRKHKKKKCQQSTLPFSSNQ